MIKITDTVKHLIIINVLFFIVTYVMKNAELSSQLAMHYPSSPQFKPWQIISHMFMHGSETHLLFNMLALWMFGSSVEQMIGRNKFLILYFASGIGAVLINAGVDYFQFNTIYTKLVNLGMSTSEINKIVETVLPYGQGYVNETYQSIYRIYHTPLVGASGALYGVMVAFGVLQPKAKMGLLFLPIMIEARIFIPLILLADVFFGVFSVKGDNIAHFAHIGGAIVGFILIWSLKKHKFKRWY